MTCLITQSYVEAEGQTRSKVLLSEKTHYADKGLCVKPFLASTDLVIFLAFNASSSQIAVLYTF